MGVERKLRSSEVARLEGISVRSLAKWVKSGRFPRPDFPAACRGASHYWLESTVEAARQQRKSKDARGAEHRRAVTVLER
jgi:predicted DNA-binding transcriptional regulator AlpA